MKILLHRLFVGLFVAFATLLVSSSAVFGQTDIPALPSENFMLFFSKDSNKLSIAIRSSQKSVEMPFTVSYKVSDELQHAVTGNFAFDASGYGKTEVYLGTCSGEVCVPHEAKSGMLELTSPTGKAAISFVIDDKGSVLVSRSNNFLIFNPQVSTTYTHPANNLVRLTFKKVAPGNHYAKITEGARGFEVVTSMAQGTYHIDFEKPEKTDAEVASVSATPKPTPVPTVLGATTDTGTPNQVAPPEQSSFLDSPFFALAFWSGVSLTLVMAFVGGFWLLRRHARAAEEPQSAFEDVVSVDATNV